VIDSKWAVSPKQVILMLVEYASKVLGKIAIKPELLDYYSNDMDTCKVAGLPKPPQMFITSFDGKHFFANPFY